MQNIIYTSIDSVTHLSAIPARWVDESFLEEPRSLLAKSFWWIKTRFYSLMLSAAMLVSAFASLLMAIGYFIRVLFTSDETQEARIACLKHYALLFSKNILGLIASLSTLFLLNLFLPQNFSLLFLEEHERKGIVNGGKDIIDENLEVRVPKDTNELSQILKDANENHDTVIPLGGGRSQGHQFIPGQLGKKRIVLDMKYFNSITIDADGKFATVGAGALWSQIQDEANKNKLAICSAQASLSIFSVGGSIGIDAHGWDIKNGMLSKTILSLTIVTPTGEIKEISPDDELFKYIPGGLGLMGIVVSAKIKLTDNIKVKRTTRDVSPEHFNDYFSNLQKEGQTVLSLARLELGDAPLARIFMENYEEIEDKNAYEAPHFHSEAEQGNRLDRILIAFLRTFDWVKKYYWESDRAAFQKEQPVMTRNEAMHFGIRSMYNHSVSQAEWLQEYFVPREEIASFLKDLGEIFKEHQVPLINATIRYVPAKDTPLSYAPEERFAVVICYNQKLNPQAIRDTKRWQRKAHQLTVEKGGSIYLAYQNSIQPDVFKRSYPQMDAFKTFKSKLDPNHVLSSGFSEKYLTQDDRPNYVAEILQDLKQEFLGFLSHVLFRVDAKPLYALLEDILQYCDTHEEIYQELCARLHEIKPNVLTDIYRMLQSLKAIKKDLGQQAYGILREKNVQCVEGLLEVGSPGRFIDEYRQHGIEVKGTIYASDDQETLLSLFPRKTYHQFIPLNFNDASSFEKIPDSSVELITCYVGLHHFDDEKLDSFLQHMRRILKPNGHFLLVDHDVENQQDLAMSHMAHIIFNAVNGVTVASELSEIRNFQNQDYWINKLQKYDLNPVQLDSENPLIRQGDPTRNRMLGFA
ncbi:MAG: hypothetical protein QG556_92 [Pseudomonadota bacterium]|nr:hypothetical protein [Pseudomonadota bacterium]